MRALVEKAGDASKADAVAKKVKRPAALTATGLPVTDWLAGISALSVLMR